MSKEYTTKRGVTIKVIPFPQLQPDKVLVAARKYAAKEWPATKPTYSEELMGGGTQTFYHDEKSIVGNPEAEAAWAKYKENEGLQTRYINDMMMKFYILNGTDVTLPEDGKWMKRQRFFGIEIPEDEMELQYHYITTELLADPEDLTEMVQVIMEVAGVDKDTLDAARNSFRRVLGKEQDATERTDGDSGGVETTGEVADLNPLHRDDGDGTLEQDAIAMGFAN